MEKANNTINVKDSTKKVLKSMRTHKRETYDDIISRLIVIFQATEPQ